ncbi:MAG: DUF3179 domain-containing (seleno)protein [Saprospiraceae bacterium]
MKRLFWTSIIALILFEAANVYFIMPMPGSQDMNSLDLAYFLNKWRWAFRILYVIGIVIGWYKSNWKRSWVPFIPLILAIAVIYMANFNMAADQMFQQPRHIIFKDSTGNQVDSNRLVLGVVINDVAKAYPIRLIGYHHHLLDTVGGKPIMVTYCTVCRTGRIYEPTVNGKQEKFRLVGMDHFNAMLEDATTKSWWRQVTGEAIAGPLKGQQLPEIMAVQSSLSAWIKMNPHTLILQADSTFIEEYGTSTNYETGKSRKKLTGTDSLSWKPKSWVVGVVAYDHPKAYDWNRLKTERIIHDQIKSTPIIVLVTKDTVGFFAYERPDSNAKFTLNENVLSWDNHHFTINGKGIDTMMYLKPLPAYQEFWHSWAYFHPYTEH